jgi:hypothetical protein
MIAFLLSVIRGVIAMIGMLRVLLAIFGCVACSVTTFAGGPFGIIRVGKWQGAAYTTDKGAFSHCTAAAKFDSSLAIIIAQNANRSWIIGIAEPRPNRHGRSTWLQPATSFRRSNIASIISTPTVSLRPAIFPIPSLPILSRNRQRQKPRLNPKKHFAEACAVAHQAAGFGVLAYSRLRLIAASSSPQPQGHSQYQYKC